MKKPFNIIFSVRALNPPSKDFIVATVQANTPGEVLVSLARGEIQIDHDIIQFDDYEVAGISIMEHVI